VTTLLQEGYQEDQAFRIAFSQAQEWATARRTTPDHELIVSYHVTPHPLGWVVRQPKGATPCLVFKSQEEAAEFGQALAEAHNSPLVIHQDSGDIHTRIVYQ
jgi:hypothetical protein